MASGDKYTIEEDTLVNIGDAIREMTETQEGITPENMPTAIRSISGGGAASLSDLDDVDTTGAADGKVLTFDNTSNKWVPAAIPTPPSEIDDSSTTAANTWSANKISSEIQSHLIADISNVTFGGE